jgi:hypothetical protein
MAMLPLQLRVISGVYAGCNDQLLACECGTDVANVSDESASGRRGPEGIDDARA